MARERVILCGPSTRAIGGGPTHIRNILGSLLADRFELYHFEVGSRGTESPAHDEALYRKLARVVLGPFGFVAVLRKKRPKLVHINSSLNHKAFWRDLVFVLLAKGYGQKILYQIHGGSLMSFCNSKFMETVADFVFSLTDAVVVLSSSEEINFKRLRRVKTVRVIPNAIDLQAYRAEARVHEGRIRRLTYLGRIARDKGLFEAIEAVAILRTQLPELEFVIAGSGPDEIEVLRRIREHSLTDRIQLIGAVHGSEKIKLLMKTDLFLFPSYHEGLPYAILEGLAAGTPVIATHVGGIPDVVEDGTHGILIPPKDPGAIVEAVLRLDRSADLGKMSTECMRRADEKVGLRRLADDFTVAYETLIANRDEVGKPVSWVPVGRGESLSGWRDQRSRSNADKRIGG